MLHFFPPGMLERYTLFVFTAVLGVVQLMAAYYRWMGFSLPGRRRWRWGYVLGTVLLGGAYLWFFGAVQPLIFQPGLAGAELFTVFSVSTLLAIGVTLALVSLLHRQVPRLDAPAGQGDHAPGGSAKEPIAPLGQRPAAIVVPDRPDDSSPAFRLAERLTNEGYLVLSLSLFGEKSVSPSQVLKQLSDTCARVRAERLTGGQAMVLIGAGIGGDLVLQAGTTEPGIAGVVAIDPILYPEATGLELLRRSTFWEALHWGSRCRRLAAALAAAECLPQLQRALLIFCASPMPPDEDVTVGGVEVVPARTDDEAIQQAVHWIAEMITRREHGV